VCIVSAGGIWKEDQGYVETMTSRLQSYESDLNQLFLACANTQMSPAKLDTIFDMLKEQVRSIHKGQLDAEVAKMQSPDGGLKFMNTPHSRLPAGTMIKVGTDGKIAEVIYDRDVIAELTKAIADGNTISTSPDVNPKLSTSQKSEDRR
jgi:hypothetical protein